MRIVALLLALITPLLACAEQAEPAKPAFDEGKHYTVIAGQPKPAATGPIKVTEVFWYGCGHCYTFEPHIQGWKKTKADDVKFVGSPAMWKQRVQPADLMWTHAKLYYTASAMSKLDLLHPAFFEAMHLKNMRLVAPEEIKKVVSEKGVDGDLFLKTMESFAVNAQVNQADQRQKTFKVTGTPEIVVGDYYHVSASKAGGQKEMIDVINFLVDKIRKER